MVHGAKAEPALQFVLTIQKKGLTDLTWTDAAPPGQKSAVWVT
jgi:hypothetical protein